MDEKKLIEKSPEYSEIAALLMKIGQQAFGIMVPVFTAFIASEVGPFISLLASAYINNTSAYLMIGKLIGQSYLFASVKPPSRNLMK